MKVGVEVGVEVKVEVGVKLVLAVCVGDMEGVGDNVLEGVDEQERRVTPLTMMPPGLPSPPLAEPMKYAHAPPAPRPLPPSACNLAPVRAPKP